MDSKNISDSETDSDDDVAINNNDIMYNMMENNTRSEADNSNLNNDYLKNEGNTNLNDILLDYMKDTGYWTKEKCQEEALKYISRDFFQFHNSLVYSIAEQNNWLDEITTHMQVPEFDSKITIKKIESEEDDDPLRKKPRGYWTKEKCQEAALFYRTRTEFQSGHLMAYTTAFRNHWLNEICGHMQRAKDKRKPRGYWTKERLKIESMKYKSAKLFKKDNPGAYVIMSRNGWLNDIFRGHSADAEPDNSFDTDNMYSNESISSSSHLHIPVDIIKEETVINPSNNSGNDEDTT